MAVVAPGTLGWLMGESATTIVWFPSAWVKK
jgi:hypothetical protein